MSGGVKHMENSKACKGIQSARLGERGCNIKGSQRPTAK